MLLLAAYDSGDDITLTATLNSEWRIKYQDAEGEPLCDS